MNKSTLLLFSFGLFCFLQQPNFKQKFVALLKRFKVTDEVSYSKDYSVYFDWHPGEHSQCQNKLWNLERGQHPAQYTRGEFFQSLCY